MRKRNKIVVRRPDKRDHLGGIFVIKKITLKWILNRVWGFVFDLTGSG
jgi:hypothetical protein